MQIIITGCKFAPSWDTLQKMIRESVDDETATLIKIARCDGGGHYRGLGKYDLAMTNNDRDYIEIKLDVRG